tara:strand:- start:1478 stop:1696 length:219 start_codon:yes stop_codon:yes gene_type:complete
VQKVFSLNTSLYCRELAPAPWARWGLFGAYTRSPVPSDIMNLNIQRPEQELQIPCPLNPTINKGGATLLATT